MDCLPYTSRLVYGAARRITVAVASRSRTSTYSEASFRASVRLCRKDSTRLNFWCEPSVSSLEIEQPLEVGA